MLNIAIIGSRYYNDYAYLSGILDQVFQLVGPFQVISGGARGADSLGCRWAKEHADLGFPEPVVFRAKWDEIGVSPRIKIGAGGKPYDAVAGFRRNQEIVDAADLIIAFWDGVSPGTKDAVAKAHKQHKPVEIYWSYGDI